MNIGQFNLIQLNWIISTFWASKFPTWIQLGNEDDKLSLLLLLLAVITFLGQQGVSGGDEDDDDVNFCWLMRIALRNESYIHTWK